MIYFSLTLWILDTWDGSLGDFFQLKFDNRILNGWAFQELNFANDNTCGESDAKDLGAVRVFGKAYHTDTALTLKIISQLDQWSSDESFGVRAVNLLFVSSPISLRESICGVASLTMSNNQCICPEGQYENPLGSGTCVACDERCKSCFGSGYRACYECASGMYYNGVGCLKCHEACATCSGESVNQCTTCHAGDFMLTGNSICLESCDNPLVTSYSGVNAYCSAPITCNSPNFINWNSVCGSCPYPLQQQVIGSVRLCKNPCMAGQYLYWNGSCHASCLSPFTISVQSGVNYCVVSCSSGYLYWDGTCSSSCPAPNGGQVIDGKSFCVYPCESHQFVYPDGSCQDTCQEFFNPVLSKGRQYCNYPCASNEFLGWNGDCLTSCNSPLQSSVESIGSFCKSPCSSPTDYYYQQTGACKETCSTLSSVDAQNQYLICLTNDLIIMDKSLFSSLLVEPNKPDQVTMLAMAKLIYPVRYLDIEMPARLEALVVGRGRSPLNIRLPQTLSDSTIASFPSSSLPGVFAERGLHARFLVNFWPELTTWLVAIVAIIVGKFLQVSFEKLQWERLRMLSERFKVVLGWNLLLMLCATGVDDLILYTALEVQGVTLYTFLGTLSFVICLLMIVISAVLFFKSLEAIPRFQTARIEALENDTPQTLQRIVRKLQNYQVAFKSFSDKGFFNQLFFLVYTARIGVPMIIAACFYGVPVLQAILYLLISIVIFCYVVFMRPIQDKTNLIQLAALEGITLIVNVFVLFLTIFSIERGSSDDTVILLGDFIIIANDLVNVLMVVFLGIKLGQILREIYNARKQSQPKKEKELWFQFPFMALQQGCMGFETVQITSALDETQVVNPHFQLAPGLTINSTGGFFRDTQIKKLRPNEKWYFEYLQVLQEEVEVFKRTGERVSNDDSAMDLIKILTLGETNRSFNKHQKASFSKTLPKIPMTLEMATIPEAKRSPREDGDVMTLDDAFKPHEHNWRKQTGEEKRGKSAEKFALDMDVTARSDRPMLSGFKGSGEETGSFQRSFRSSQEEAESRLVDQSSVSKKRKKIKQGKFNIGDESLNRHNNTSSVTDVRSLKKGSFNISQESNVFYSSRTDEL